MFNWFTSYIGLGKMSTPPYESTFVILLVKHHQIVVISTRFRFRIKKYFYNVQIIYLRSEFQKPYTKYTP